MGAQPERGAPLVPIESAADLRQFVGRLAPRENFELVLVSTYPRPGWNGAGNVVWCEGIIEPDQNTFDFFYDDGVLPEFDAEGDPIGDTDDNPCVTCSLSEIVGVRRLREEVV